ncbi:hypothetical protein J3Q64DRAFT_1827861 [Phycomyces blakesleeanus]|uniref:Uncharacterized protein n=2 Tax=Phycomyces blakesleeanus TaxID=4837 RepID=A0A162NCG2_PHYB8|nr:hypothetical protein PHYBLDRAFT_183305 [Phycomyces blakesleeanus NRRL 1555(-)]OAD68054.1 hypothetical protein PHYBLDRAFT_183305 [Phycomyces blakesleeanus NRRL 1555(-)]|eukprot:XP_018286094.1 hypothetical protein PHYBLDRAFT_183305 [Phycomyces blakesleeanus NRRL 1555(-)]
MGLVEKMRHKLDLHKLDQYTKRRRSQSQFESHDRSYYEAAYHDGDYLDPTDSNSPTSNRNHPSLSYKSNGWSITDVFKKNKSTAGPNIHLKTSETYTYGRPS